MRVVVPPQSVDRNDDNWLYHRTDVLESVTNHNDEGAMRASSHDLARWTACDSLTGTWLALCRHGTI